MTYDMTLERHCRVPLYTKVAVHLRKDIATRLKPGEKLEAEGKLAVRFGVSIRTIREAISSLAHEGLVERHQGSGNYVKNQAPLQHVAVILGISSSFPHQNYFVLRQVEQLHVLFRAQGYSVQVYWNYHDKESQVIDACFTDFERSLHQQRVCGMVTVAGSLNSSWREAIQKSNIPAVGSITEYRYEIDRFHMMKEGVRRLVEAGRRKIAVLEYLDSSGDKTWNDLCRTTLGSLFNQYGIHTSPSWIRGNLRASSLETGGYEEFKKIWMAEKEKPDGLLVCDDYLYQDASLAILELGIKVPKQLMVVTHANKGSSVIYPFPTLRMEWDPDQIAQIQSDLLIRFMKGESVKPQIIPIPFAWVEINQEKSNAKAPVSSVLVGDQRMVLNSPE